MIKVFNNLFNSKYNWLLLFLVTTSFPAFGDTQVLLSKGIKTTSSELNYANNPRLAQVIENGLSTLTADTTPIYWLGAALLDLESPDVKQEKRQALEQLKSLARYWRHDIEAVEAISVLYLDLEKKTFNQRLQIPINFDLVRIQDNLNPRLSGYYQLILPPRPDTVLILGAVKQPGHLIWEEGGDVSTYLQASEKITSAENSTAWVIQPDGVIEQHDFAYWNKKNKEIAPGAIIFLGFNSQPFGLPTKLSSINEELVALLRNLTL